jgi:DNA-binding NtrC family response regulator
MVGPNTPWVFLAEDDPGMRMAIKRALEFEGHRVIAAGDGPGILSDIKHMARSGLAAGSVLITDVDMPGMDGFTLVDEMTAQGIDLPVIFMSGLTGFETLRKSREHCARYFFNKPFALDDFLEAVSRLSKGK